MSQTNTNKKIRSILERSSNINAQTLQKYTNKKLSKEEQHEIEKQLLNSSFASEALEGFENADFKVNIVASTHELNKEIKKYNKERGFYKNDYRILYAAASVALIFVVLLGMFHFIDIKPSSGTMAMESKTAQIERATNEEQSELSDLALDKEEIENDEIIKTEISKKDEIPNKITEQNTTLTLDKEITAQKDFSTSDIWITKVENDSTSVFGGSESVESSPNINENVTTINIEQLADDDNILIEKKYDRSEKKLENKLFEALQAYENKKYTEANLLFDSYLVSNPNDAQALYFGGMSYYENHNYKKGISLLEKFLKQKNSIIYQKNHTDAEWYLANSYLKTKQKQKAKSLLQKIADSNSKYSSQATSLLKK